ncbi:aldehyde dehydrogenase [Spongiibacter nanhainus]|uniref:Aldehyde dehydrogenase n=1 Tax=Spongiibacter nanhainus TaxID=2794344 RepID=A0A7T4QYV0_9GAMM|nr:aldehyde dehydrogenase family protein [Spongiibacter nanhainus]QQD17305.1 aldehyde dehydrogenase [Spongiibacter nanhainus]
MSMEFNASCPQACLLIGDQIIEKASGGVYTHINPATGKAQAEIPLAGVEETESAIATAVSAFEVWRAMPGRERALLLNRFADLIKANATDFQRLAVIEGGTPFSVAAGGAGLAEEWTRYYAGWADKLDGQVVSSYPNDEFIYTLPEPYGVIGIVVTWNGPLISLGMKVIPALAAGNTVVVKPAEQTPFVAALFGKLALEAGIPPGVINILPGGVESAQTLIAHPDVQKVSFTGGPVTARKILHQCAELLKPSVMELGGKSANIVFDDADLDSAAQHAAMMSVGLLSGQGCELPTRLLVQEGVYDEMVEKVVAIAKSLPIGDPRDVNTFIGPVINAEACHRILSMVGRAKAAGAGRLVLGGERLSLEGDLADGFYVSPTIFADVDPYSEIAQQEVFGPVLVIQKFSSEEEAITIANATQYGLGGYIQTNDLKRAHRVAAALKTGFVHINGSRNIPSHAPFGGLGLSGFGKEGGRPGLDEFVRLKTVSLSQ